MTNDERKSIEDIQGTGGFRVIQSLVQKKINELDTVKDLDITANISIEHQAWAKKVSVEWLEKFLEEINLLPKEAKETRRTYE